MGAVHQNATSLHSPWGPLNFRESGKDIRSNKWQRGNLAKFSLLFFFKSIHWFQLIFKMQDPPREQKKRCAGEIQEAKCMYWVVHPIPIDLTEPYLSKHLKGQLGLPVGDVFAYSRSVSDVFAYSCPVSDVFSCSRTVSDVFAISRPLSDVLLFPAPWVTFVLIPGP